MPEYNPFDKPLSEVESGDIYQLEVPEGYYCEYKRSLIDNSDIAKSISSFANTYGGLLFIGIEEDSETNKPSDWFTLTGDDPSQYKETVRNTVADYLNPPPRFTTYSFKGSSQSTGDQGYVIMVSVPESRNTPHIHNDGRVYRRTGEGSDPYTELNDPGVLDDLHQRRDQWQERAQEFCQRDLGLTKLFVGNSESNFDGLPLLELYGVPTTLDDYVCHDVITGLDRFKDVVSSSEMFLGSDDPEITDESVTSEMGVDADTYRATSSGLVAQSWTSVDEHGNADVAHTPLSIKFFSDGSAKFFIPVATLPVSEMPENSLSRKAVMEALDFSYDEIVFIDGENMLVTVYNLLNMYSNLLREFDWPEESNDVFIKSRLVNGYRTMPVFDADWYRDLVLDYGPPVCYDQVVESPRGNPLQHRFDLSEGDRVMSVMTRSSIIFQVFGLPIQKSDEMMGSFMDIIKEYNSY